MQVFSSVTLLPEAFFMLEENPSMGGEFCVLSFMSATGL